MEYKTIKEPKEITRNSSGKQMKENKVNVYIGREWVTITSSIINIADRN